jgi:hypothetical protein
MGKPLHYLIFTLLIILVPACKTRKSLIEVKDQVKPSTKTIAEIIPAEISFEWFDGKFNADINNEGKSNSVKGRVRIRRDSLIWISIKPDVAIIEVFRILISPDSVQVVNYLDKKFFKDKFSAIKEFIKYDLSFHMVQNIFIGNPTFALDISMFKSFVNREGVDVISSSDFKTYVDARNADQPANFLFQGLWFKDKILKRSLVYDPANKVEVDLQYLEHEMMESLMLPKTGQLTVIGAKTNLRFSYTYTKIILNQVLEFPFTIPNNYEPMYLKE